MKNMSKLQSVYTKIGTENYSRYSNGNIFPVTALPHGMAEWCIQTDGAGGNWFYNPRHRTFEGIRLTHQPSPWVGDYGAVLFLPTSGEDAIANCAHSSYRPENAVIEPYVIRAELLRYRVEVELAPTERGGIFRITNKSGKRSGFAIMPYDRSELKVCGRTVEGYIDSTYKWGKEDIREYIHIEFDCDIKETESLASGGIRVFTANADYEVRVSHSFISLKQAAANCGRELDRDFAAAIKDAEAAWENALSAIDVSDEDEKLRSLFYSCMYRAMLYPIKFYEYDADGNAIHYNPDAKGVFSGFSYANNGFWDTYRTIYPLLSIVDPEAEREMIEGFVNYSEEADLLPKWLAPGNTDQMPGNLIEAVFADAVVKGVAGDDLVGRIHKLLVKNAYGGRKGIQDYIKYGYFPCDAYGESVNETLDNAYGDFCVSQVAAVAGDGETAKELYARSKNYKNIFDAESGFMRGRDANGEFRCGFDPIAWGRDYCEGSPWQNSFAVCHDVEGLAELYGGKEEFLNKLNELVNTPPTFEVGGYGFEIHEMSEMAAADFGQLAISNQPSFHIPYLFAALGDRESAEKIVENIVKAAFSAHECGFPGDEDNGSMAAWLIFAALGFYPLCPGKAEYVATKPMFREIKINGRTIPYFKESIIRHTDIVGGGRDEIDG